MDKVQVAVDDLCAEIRAVAGESARASRSSVFAHPGVYSLVPLVDAFALSDHIINSPLGKFDGSVYESYFAQVQASNPTPKVHPYFDRLIKPLLERENALIEDTGAEMGLDEELEEMKAEREEAEKEKEKVKRVEAKVRKEEYSGVLPGGKVDDDEE